MAALGFGVAGFGVAVFKLGGRAATTGAGLLVSAGCHFPCAVVAAGEVFAATIFGLAVLTGLILLTLAFAAGFFADADSSFFSVNSNAGLGRERSCGPSGLTCGVVRVMSAAGFTPAAAAALAADDDNA